MVKLRHLRPIASVVLLTCGCSQGVINPPEGQDFIGTEQERQKFEEMTRGNLRSGKAGKQFEEMTDNPQDQELGITEDPK